MSWETPIQICSWVPYHISDHTFCAHTVWYSQLSRGDMSLMNNPNRTNTLFLLSHTVLIYSVGIILPLSFTHTHINSYGLSLLTHHPHQVYISKNLTVLTETNHLEFPVFFFISSSCTSCSSAVQINADGIPWMRPVEEKHIYTFFHE